jgi:DNA-binding response OmpR family regulator
MWRLRKAINITGEPDVIQTVRSMDYSFETTD